jgi:hypothetical protein
MNVAKLPGTIYKTAELTKASGGGAAGPVKCGVTDG